MLYLSENDKKYLLKTARKELEEMFMLHSKGIIDRDTRIKNLQFEHGVFVTLYNKAELRGCIGRMESGENIVKLVRKMTISAATQDHRFKSVSAEEVDDLCIEISVLSPKIKINSIDEFDLTKHGIYIKKGNKSGTFLPQVAKETGWEKEELLGRCSRDKAGLGWAGWKDAELFVYEVINFSEVDFRE